MAKAKQNNTYRKLVAWMLVLLVFFALAGAGYVYVRNYLNNRLEEHQAQVQAENEQRQKDYQDAVAAQADDSVVVVNEQWPTPAATGWDVVDLTNFAVASARTVSVTRAQMIQGGLAVVNRWHELRADFDENALVSLSNHSRADEDRTNNIPARNSSVTILPTAAEALMRLYADARAAGLEMDYIVVDEAYRSQATQTELWDKTFASLGESYQGDARIARARQTTAYPGTSDYQAGLSFYLYNYKSGDTAFSNTPLHNTEQGKWIYQNCWKYGFVFRFPIQGFPYEDTVDKSFKTGINIKNNKVYRYVGVANAAAMNTLGLCLEEYVEYLMEHPHIAVYEDGALRYEIYRVEGGFADTTVGLPNGAASYSVSSDNISGLIVSVTY